MNAIQLSGITIPAGRHSIEIWMEIIGFPAAACLLSGRFRHQMTDEGHLLSKIFETVESAGQEIVPLANHIIDIAKDLGWLSAHETLEAKMGAEGLAGRCYAHALMSHSARRLDAGTTPSDGSGMNRWQRRAQKSRRH